jgi:tRNA U34 5-carboxymethylaminomethyl modifying GTPase MnmE/TrmE
LAATVIDTAGLDSALARADEGAIDGAAQAESMEIVAKADVILLVLDASDPTPQLDTRLIEQLTGKRIVTVLNKSDLPPRLEAASLPEPLRPTVRISAEQQTGIPDLIQTIRQTCNVADFEHHIPIAFTPRQTRLLDELLRASSRERVVSCVTQLLEDALGA